MRMCPHRIGEQVDFTTADNPNAIWPQTTWTAVEGSFPLASSSSHSLGSTGGAETVTLTTDQIPSHNHQYAINIQHSDGEQVSGESLTSGLTVGGRRRYFDTSYATGGGQAHDNMPPFVTVNRWKRVA